MAEDRVLRKLAAILAADVVGYSALIRTDEEGTREAVRRLFGTVVEPTIATHRGRIFKTMGDGFLAEFQSIVDAVRCAAAMQIAIAQANSGIAEDHQIAFRVGVNLGDVMAEGDDLHGDGVNVAARLETLAEPNGVCISGSAFEQVRDKLDLGFEDLGGQSVKNIDRPVRAYRLLTDPAASGSIVAAATKRTMRWRSAAIAATILAVLAIAALAWWQPWIKRGAPLTAESAALPLPAKPSIAVLAFKNMSDDPSQDYFADGMSEDIITGLSKLSGLFIIARNSSFLYKGRDVGVKQIGRELGVGHVVEGSVRRAGDTIRITAQLIDTETGEHLWGDRYDGRLDDVFALQDKVTGQIIDALSINLGAEETAKLADRGTSSIEAHDSFLKGQELARQYALEDWAQAIEHFKHALEIDPNYSRAAAAVAQILYYVWRDNSGMGRRAGLPWPNEAMVIAKEYAQRALERPGPGAHIAQALLLRPARKYDEAIEHAEKAIALDPNDSEAYLSLADSLVLAGEPARAISHYEKARRLDPRNIERIDQGLGLAFFGMERFDEAAQYLEQARDAAPADNLNWMYLAATYAHLQQIDKATAAAERMNSLRKEQGINSFRTDMLFLWYFQNANDEKRLKEGLMKAGVPEKSF